MKYTCPVCGYNGLDKPPADYEICPSCGTEFGYNDAAPSAIRKRLRQRELTRQWIRSGMNWFDAGTQPANWERVKYGRLRNIGVLDFQPSAEETHQKP